MASWPEQSARKACKTHKLPEDLYLEKIERLVTNTNGVNSRSGGYDRSTLAEYSQAVAHGIRRCREEGLGNPLEMSFGELYNYGDSEDERARKFTVMRIRNAEHCVRKVPTEDCLAFLDHLAESDQYGDGDWREMVADLVQADSRVAWHFYQHGGASTWKLHEEHLAHQARLSAEHVMKHWDSVAFDMGEVHVDDLLDHYVSTSGDHMRTDTDRVKEALVGMNGGSETFVP